MYIHGGRDLKEGTVASMWRVNLTLLQQLHQGDNQQVGWSPVTTTGKDLGRISHHSCAMVSAKEVAFFGGMQGDNSFSGVSLLNMLNLQWATLNV